MVLNVTEWSRLYTALLGRLELVMPQCTMHRRHMVVRSCVGSSVPLFVGLLVRQILHIFVSGELQVLKVGQYAKHDILVR